MPPKADPKAKAKAESKAKAKAKKKVEEEDPESKIPKVERPDQDAQKEALQKIQDGIEKLQKEQRGYTEKINERSGGKTEFFQKKQEIRAKLDTYSAEMDKLQAQKAEINSKSSATRQQGVDMRNDLNKMKKSIGYTDEADIDNRIATIEFKLWTESITLKEEKKYLQEIQELKKNRPKVSQVSKMENDAKALISEGQNVKQSIGEINEQMAHWRGLKKEVQEELTALMEDRKNQMGDLPEIIQKREDINGKIQELIKERNACRDAFKEKEREYYAYEKKLREARQEKIFEEKRARQAEMDLVRKQKAADKLDDQPYVQEITLIEQTISFCKSLSSVKVDKEEAKTKQTVFDNPEGTMVMMKKEDRDEEFYLAPTAKGKKSKGKKSGGKDEKKPIKHNAETFRLFDSLKLDAPLTVDDVPATLEKLEEKLTHFQDKVKEWEVNRDEIKRKILEEGYNPEEAEAKEAAEETKVEAKEDKEEDKQEAKEEEKEEEKDEE